jgi:hypothetical protein
MRSSDEPTNLRGMGSWVKRNASGVTKGAATALKGVICKKPGLFPDLANAKLLRSIERSCCDTEERIA